jgi:hypothetical protein
MCPPGFTCASNSLPRAVGVRTMKQFFVFVTALISIGCAGHGGPAEASSLKLASPSGAQLERLIFARHQELSALNASLGYPQPTVITNQTRRLRQFASLISTRLDNDMTSAYRRTVRPAEETYLIMGRFQEKYVVFVIRVADIRPGGYYTNLEGLAYEFRPGATQPDGVAPTSY